MLRHALVLLQRVYTFSECYDTCALVLLHRAYIFSECGDTCALVLLHRGYSADAGLASAFAVLASAAMKIRLL